MQHAVRSFARKHPHAVLVATAVSLVVTLAAVETSGVLPLEGQATPMYGPLKTPGKSSSSRTAAVSSKSKSSRVVTRISSPSSLRGAAPSSAVAKKWTGNECSSGKHSSAECVEKLRAAVNGDMACFLDTDCYDQTRFCGSLSKNDCDALKVRRWAYDAFFPGCATDECAADVTVLASAKAPKALKECVRSPLCRELLADFRRGDFACRRHVPCLEAIAALTADASCGSLPWCKDIKAIDERYTKYAFKCTDGPNAECMSMIKIDEFVSESKRRVECSRDSLCSDEAQDMSSALGYGYSYPSLNIGCFLWAECKNEFKENMDWACRSTINRQPMCANYTAVWEFLTKTNPSCVFSGETATCQNALKKLYKK